MKTTQKRMKIILNESQVKKLLDTLTKETILEQSEKQRTLKLMTAI
jgi:DNA-binding IclR family transcriptional regulator